MGLTSTYEYVPFCRFGTFLYVLVRKTYFFFGTFWLYLVRFDPYIRKAKKGGVPERYTEVAPLIEFHHICVKQRMVRVNSVPSLPVNEFPKTRILVIY